MRSTRRATASMPAQRTTSRSFPPRIHFPAPTTTRSRRFTALIRLAPTSRARLGRWKGLTRSEETMSVEIEVGFESAASVKVPLPERPEQELAPKPLTSPKIRRALIIGGAVLAAVLVGLLIYFHNRESTDDAQVDGHITPVASKVYGRVAEVLVDDNQAVKAGEVLVKIEAGDYQAALDQAKAALALAEGEARSAGVDVPRTSETANSNTSSAEAQLLGAQAELARAEATYEQAQTADLAGAPANVEKSRAHALLARADLERYTPLMEKGEISKQQYDAAKANADATSSALVADEQRLAQGKRRHDNTNAQP